MIPTLNRRAGAAVRALYLANASTEPIRAAMRAGLIGQMCTPAEGRVPLPLLGLDGRADCVWFAADNGCYGGRFPGEHPWHDWLTTLVDEHRRQRCLFAVAPDQFDPALGADMGAVSLARSRPFLREVRRLGVPVALVAQNGLTPAQAPWAEIDCLFLGGCRTCPRCGWWPEAATLIGRTCPHCGASTPEWKTSPAAHRLALAAHRRGVRLHMGRVNSRRRWRTAEVFGAASCDGTFLANGPDRNLPRLLAWPDHNLFTHLIGSDHREPGSAGALRGHRLPRPPLPRSRAAAAR
jgi:hypothetical protein